MTQTIVLHHIFEDPESGGRFALAVYMVIATLFTLIDTLPLVVKFFSVSGPYDMLQHMESKKYAPLHDLNVFGDPDLFDEQHAAFKRQMQARMDLYQEMDQYWTERVEESAPRKKVEEPSQQPQPAEAVEKSNKGFGQFMQNQGSSATAKKQRAPQAKPKPQPEPGSRVRRGLPEGHPTPKPVAKKQPAQPKFKPAQRPRPVAKPQPAQQKVQRPVAKKQPARPTQKVQRPVAKKQPARPVHKAQTIASNQVARPKPKVKPTQRPVAQLKKVATAPVQAKATPPQKRTKRSVKVTPKSEQKPKQSGRKVLVQKSKLTRKVAPAVAKPVVRDTAPKVYKSVGRKVAKSSNDDILVS